MVDVEVDTPCKTTPTPPPPGTVPTIVTAPPVPEVTVEVDVEAELMYTPCPRDPVPAIETAPPAPEVTVEVYVPLDSMYTPSLMVVGLEFKEVPLPVILTLPPPDVIVAFKTWTP